MTERDEKPADPEIHLTLALRSDDTASLERAAEQVASSSGLLEAILEIARERRVKKSDTDERIGRFRLIRELGRGGQAVVWLAKDEELGRQVALKVIRESVVDGARLVARFRREAEITSKLDHPSICPVYEVGLDEAPWIAMRFIEGETLSSRIASIRKENEEGSTEQSYNVSFSGENTTEDEDPQTEKQLHASVSSGPSTQRDLRAIAKTIERIARALHAAHEVGVIHRDIKPANLMVDTDGVPVVLDFGLAKDKTVNDADLTMSGDLMGTPAYMSPEQLMAQRITLDRRTDVYSLGVTLFECLTGIRPFKRPTREALYNAIMTEEAPRVRRLNSAVSKDLEVVVETTLQKNRDHRYQTALEFAEDLRRFSEYEPIAARPAGPWTRVVRWGQRNPMVASMLIVVFLAVGSAAGIFAWKSLQLTTALGERDEANTSLTAQREELSDSLNRVTRLKDGRRLRLHLEDAETLYPARPDRIADLKAWLADTATLLESLPAHRATLDSLVAKAGPYTKEQRALDHPEALSQLASARLRAERLAKALGEADSDAEEDRLDSELDFVDSEIERFEVEITERKSWGFDDEESWLHELLSDLVVRLAELEMPDGLAADVRARLATAREILPRTVGDHAESWKDALARIRVNKLYGNLVLQEHVGLIPLGPDPVTGFEEFLHWESHARGAESPERDKNGRFSIGNETGIILVLLPGGVFRMGTRRPESSHDVGANFDPNARRDELPVHDVELSPFFLGKYEVTRGQWVRMTGEADPSYWNVQNSEKRLKEEELARCPVELINWLTSDRWLSRVGLALPTESQWEYGCRAGSENAYFFGNDPSEIVKYGNIADRQYRSVFGSRGNAFNDVDDGHGVYAPVGSYDPNAFGLFDVYGNVWEWCRDWYGSYAVDNVEAGSGLRRNQGSVQRIFRGGSFVNTAVLARSARRNGATEKGYFNCLGLRASAPAQQ